MVDNTSPEFLKAYDEAETIVDKFNKCPICLKELYQECHGHLRCHEHGAVKGDHFCKKEEKDRYLNSSLSTLVEKMLEAS